MVCTKLVKCYAFFLLFNARNKYGNADLFFFLMNAQNLNMASGAGGNECKQLDKYFKIILWIKLDNSFFFNFHFLRTITMQKLFFLIKTNANKYE